jgi:hypothetical protein
LYYNISHFQRIIIKLSCLVFIHLMGLFIPTCQVFGYCS